MKLFVLQMKFLLFEAVCDMIYNKDILGGIFWSFSKIHWIITIEFKAFYFILFIKAQVTNIFEQIWTDLVFHTY